MTKIILDTNYSLWASERLSDQARHLCNSTSTQADWENAGWSKFRKVRLKISTNGLSVDRTDTTYARTNRAKTDPKEYGTAGDCYSQNKCNSARKGKFAIDFTDRGVHIDWERTGDWKPNGLENGNIIVNFTKTVATASANCGGWCGDCKPSTEIYLIPDDRGIMPNYYLYRTLYKITCRPDITIFSN